ncbi:MAG: hypothetical protein K2Q01_00785 [Rickettsiales bacterium]|nr:hypothetical protein [Rickettsiales bacterium]
MAEGKKEEKPELYQESGSEKMASAMALNYVANAKPNDKLVDAYMELLTYNPKRQDYLIARTNKEGKVIKFDKMTGLDIRAAHALVMAESIRTKLDNETYKVYRESIKAYPAYATLKDKSSEDLIAGLNITEEERKSVKKKFDAYNEKSDEEKTAARAALLNMAVINQAQADVEGSRLAQKLIKEAQERKKNGMPPVTPGKDGKPMEKGGGRSASITPETLGLANADLLAAIMEAGNTISANTTEAEGKTNLPFRNATVSVGRRGGGGMAA